ncbi:hypothetical protein FSP39_018568 [Pinctada imbricata]|uniref:Chitin-binding type-2 domain-containing protein n=1 Tax=Pinctada imbricata TaxID=66713 RepID=A0AA88Y9Y6_PINIB|nr:hypothetical protein FSP39_018568 [Pinctada imbricata]
MLSCVKRNQKERRGSPTTLIAAPTAKPQNIQCKNTEQTLTERDMNGTRNINLHQRNMEHKRLYLNQRDQWATDADLGWPSATQVADAPSWVKHFDERNRKDLSLKQEDKWSADDRSIQDDIVKNRAVRNIQPYDADYDGDSQLSRSTSDLNIPRIHKVQTDPAMYLSEEEKKIKKRRRRRMLEETSGYSTTSLSEVSEVDTPRKERGRHNELQVPSGKQKRDSDVRSDLSRNSRGSQATTRRESEASMRCGNDTPRSHTPRREGGHARIHHGRSTSDLVSNASAPSQRSNNQRRPSNASSNIQKYSSPNERKISQVHVDPFDFIQPVPEPFSRRMKKTLGPIMGILLMIILAASLGAAIYFAVELKKMLRANLALKIKSTTFGGNVDDLSKHDLSQLAMTYCQQMDFYYRKSQFESTYRGCEVVSIKNDNINFTLFFVEKDASKRDIISVIETSAPKVSNVTENVAVVDKFEIELESVKIKIEHERTPVGFSKIKSKSRKETTTITVTTRAIVTTTLPPTSSSSTTTKTRPLPVTSSKPKTKKTKPTTRAVTTTATTTMTVTMSSTTDVWDDWTTTEAVITEEMLLAWEPCSKKNGSFFPHPIECHLYFQCSHKQSILQKCTGDLLFDADANNCVQDRPGLECPDGNAAPPEPPKLLDQSSTLQPTTAVPVQTASTEKVSTKRTNTRPVYPGRPDYPKKPCLTADAGTLHAHPDDCAKFIQCIGGGAGQELACATNLVYDPDTKSCIYPRNDLICPDILPCLQKNNGYFPHPFNCSLYIQCESGREKTQQCAPGLIWDARVNSCVLGSIDSSNCQVL